MSWFSRITSGLSRTASTIGTGLKTALGLEHTLDAPTRAMLEESLLSADVGTTATEALLKDLARTTAASTTSTTLAHHLAALMAQKLQVLVPATPLTTLLAAPSATPTVIVLAGVNGAGKTTTLGKLAAQWAAEGHTVIVAAADTFRAAATAQLAEWTTRAHAAKSKGGSVTIVEADSPKSDAASVAYRALEAATAQNARVVLVDTAGRLPNRTDLLAELPKLARVLKKQNATAPHHTWLVLDATLGQSTLSQIDQFAAQLGTDMPLTGLIVTKLDGSAKAGFLLALAARPKPLPVIAIGVGESLEDLGPFSPTAFAHALVGLESPSPTA